MDNVQSVKQWICKKRDTNRIRIYSNCNQDHVDSYLVIGLLSLLLVSFLSIWSFNGFDELKTPLWEQKATKTFTEKGLDPLGKRNMSLATNIEVDRTETAVTTTLASVTTKRS
ncbi:hypothetical protein BDF20DRAFT_990248 [Mycotypha africana]|uniref:uncharacterized protein n=1 Tax=Mycotypha africana TaxID=64632 RepID=UPI0023016B12|nr:uncharacterized protein BDF20DRAFT_990248 [Mycotypha africana]KAI8972051.1 hypothetical protein BDF20DRAFT_990248 [Mycotypha africana]